MKQKAILVTCAVLISYVSPLKAAPQTDQGTVADHKQTESQGQNTRKTKKPGEGGGTDTLVVDGFFDFGRNEAKLKTNGKTWKVTNPEQVKAKQGQKVRVKGTFDFATGEVYIKNVRTIPSEGNQAPQPQK